MRTVMYLLTVSVVAASLAGCGSSRSASEQVRDICAQARTHFDSAVDIIRSTSVEGLSEQDNAERVLAELEKAAALTREALAVEGAGENAKMTANRLMAEIRYFAASTMTTVARQAQMKLQADLPAFTTAVDILAARRADMSFIEELATARAADSGAELAEIAQQVRQRFTEKAQQASQRIDAANKQLEGLQQEIQRLSDTAEPIRRQAVELRRRMARTAGTASLELDTQAAELEQRYAEMQDAIAELELKADAKRRELAIESDVLASLRRTVEAAAANIDRLSSRGADIAAERTDLQAKVDQAQAVAAEQADTLAATFGSVAGKYRQAIEAYDDAAARIATAARQAAQVATQARQLKSESPSSPVEKVLGDMSARSAGSDILARQGDINLQAAETRRELLENAQRVSRLLGAAGVNDELLQDTQAITEQAMTDYAAAIEAYEKTADKFSEAQRWMIDTLRAKAMLGEYLLGKITGKPDRQPLMQAAEILQAMLTDNRDKPEYFQAVQLAQAIQAEMTGNSQP